MNLFRSEEQPEAGDDSGNPARRAAQAWWATGVAGLAPHTPEQNQAILDRCGLTGEFWKLPR